MVDGFSINQISIRPRAVRIVNDISEDQEAEIEQMNAVLVSLSTDPRANLKPGFWMPSMQLAT